MIAPIPNQPVAFNTTLLQGCLCDAPERCLLALPTDTLQFQFGGVLCSGVLPLNDDTNFTSHTNWVAPAWSISNNRACVELSIATFISSMTETSFIPTVGEAYVVEVVVESMSGTLDVSFGGVALGSLTSPGTHIFSCIAANTSPLSFTPDGYPISGCLSIAAIYEANTDITVELFNLSDDTLVETFDYASNPERYAFDRDHFTITYPLSEGYDLNGCYYIVVTDECDGVELQSQCINVADHACTILVTACNTGDAGGIYFGDYTHSMRVYGKLVRPTYEYTERTNRLSNGYLDRYYVDRQRILELRIDRLDWRGHDFISTLSIQDHVYLGQTEYAVDPEAYEPVYGDVFDDQGGILLKVRPKQELVRKVRCSDDDANCAPPPNYWVENTGPNEDYILQEDNADRILLNS